MCACVYASVYITISSCKLIDTDSHIHTLLVWSAVLTEKKTISDREPSKHASEMVGVGATIGFIMVNWIEAVECEMYRDWARILR